ncbi:hypothetical protein LTR70_002220 [Exophiala xenobiotica]|uniref:Uncharacterized protein n=1 Tax=Lithohypha guttulata TaxID=1690604 RepID=A0ABR0KLE4_9EURO|nr:hypothetical protein LTR24_001359 [Lithohypha guttulata]KAK5325955.1 hypothetical protein LTR70_002220 [Exophiala xenobiotica]
MIVFADLQERLPVGNARIQALTSIYIFVLRVFDKEALVTEDALQSIGKKTLQSYIQGMYGFDPFSSEDSGDEYVEVPKPSKPSAEAVPTKPSTQQVQTATAAPAQTKPQWQGSQQHVHPTMGTQAVVGFKLRPQFGMFPTYQASQAPDMYPLQGGPMLGHQTASAAPSADGHSHRETTVGSQRKSEQEDVEESNVDNTDAQPALSQADPQAFSTRIRSAESTPVEYPTATLSVGGNVQSESGSAEEDPAEEAHVPAEDEAWSSYPQAGYVLENVFDEFAEPKEDTRVEILRRLDAWPGFQRDNIELMITVIEDAKRILYDTSSAEAALAAPGQLGIKHIASRGVLKEMIREFAHADAACRVEQAQQLQSTHQDASFFQLARVEGVSDLGGAAPPPMSMAMGWLRTDAPVTRSGWDVPAPSALSEDLPSNLKPKIEEEHLQRNKIGAMRVKVFRGQGTFCHKCRDGASPHHWMLCGVLSEVYLRKQDRSPSDPEDDLHKGVCKTCPLGSRLAKTHTTKGHDMGTWYDVSGNPPLNQLPAQWQEVLRDRERPWPLSEKGIALPPYCYFPTVYPKLQPPDIPRLAKPIRPRLLYKFHSKYTLKEQIKLAIGTGEEIKPEYGHERPLAARPAAPGSSRGIPPTRGHPPTARGGTSSNRGGAASGVRSSGTSSRSGSSGRPTGSGSLPQLASPGKDNGFDGTKPGHVSSPSANYGVGGAGATGSPGTANGASDEQPPATPVSQPVTGHPDRRVRRYRWRSPFPTLYSTR